MITPPWLSEDEAIFHRMETFHRQRVDEISSGRAPLKVLDGGILVVHLIARQCAGRSKLIEPTRLRDFCKGLHPLGDTAHMTAFNVDGIYAVNNLDQPQCYTMLRRNGSLESAMADACFCPREADKALRDTLCEKAVIGVTAQYLEMCKSASVAAPVWLFAALINCVGARIFSDRYSGITSKKPIDRSPLHLPAFELDSLDLKPQSCLRAWCDILWQACGEERSLNFDQDGQWQRSRR